MEILLTYVDPDVFPVPPGWTAVGFLGGGPTALAYDPERTPHAVEDGVPKPLDPVAVNAALAPAVEAAASRLWPQGWTYAISEAFRLNRRSVQRDRITRSGLHPVVLRTLGAMSCHEDAEGIGRLLHALAHYADAHTEGNGDVDRLDDAMRAAANALDGLKRVRTGRALRPRIDADNCED
ncbi:hypothetical protein [Methylobacterium flocculans]|uniref:hypothetical protein n=1 Tax=Methylobacterium flocculans TaxID=2984843 RepID=UPI0021F29525|nr:hypothetical protein [Methylobacterium sp. FF17]